MKQHAIYLSIVLGASLFAFIQNFTLLSPILLSFLLIFLISLAFNPGIMRMRALTGGRKVATGPMMVALLLIIALTGWAFPGPLQDSVAKLSQQLPTYWERLQKPLIKMEQQAVLCEEKLQAEVTAEIARIAAEEGTPAARRPLEKQTPMQTPKESESFRSSLSQMVQGVVGRFTAVAFNAAQILIVLVMVFFGVTFTLTNPRPLFGALFSLVPEQDHGQALAMMQRIEPAWPAADSAPTSAVVLWLLPDQTVPALSALAEHRRIAA